MVKVKQHNPFSPAELVEKRLKVLVYGDSGVGKTWFSLTFPGKVALIDCEGGSELYGGRDDVAPFDVLRTKNYDELMEALDFIEADGGKTYQTVVIDPLTVIWQVLQDAAALNNERRVKEGKLKDASLSFRDWGVIKRRINRLYTRLVNLPTHVVVTARQKDEYSAHGADLVKVGTKPDSEKSTPYLFDVCLKLCKNAEAKYWAVVEKDRSGTLPASFDDPSFAALAGIASSHSAGVRVQAEPEEAAAQAEAEKMATEEAEQTQKRPVNVPAKYARPMLPTTLYEYINKRLNDETPQNRENICTAEDAQNLAASWEQHLGHNKDQRHAVASYLIGDEVVTFNELSVAEVTVLERWLTADVQMAYAEADGILKLLEASAALQQA